MDLMEDQFTYSLILGVIIAVVVPKIDFNTAEFLQNPLCKTIAGVALVMFITPDNLQINTMLLLGILVLFSTVEQRNIERVIKKNK